MQLEKRIQIILFLVIGIIFILSGIALNEINIISKVNHSTLSDWYNFLLPWIGSGKGGLKHPWGGP